MFFCETLRSQRLCKFKQKTLGFLCFLQKKHLSVLSIGMSIGMRLEADKQTQPLPPTGSGCE